MSFALVVFRSRTQTMRLVDAMRARGGRCSVVQTPLQARVGCGISAKIFLRDVTVARTLIYELSLSSFVGFYVLEQVGDRAYYRKL